MLNYRYLAGGLIATVFNRCGNNCLAALESLDNAVGINRCNALVRAFPGDCPVCCVLGRNSAGKRYGCADFKRGRILVERDELCTPVYGDRNRCGEAALLGFNGENRLADRNAGDNAVCINGEYRTVAGGPDKLLVACIFRKYLCKNSRLGRVRNADGRYRESNSRDGNRNIDGAFSGLFALGGGCGDYRLSCGNSLDNACGGNGCNVCVLACPDDVFI